MSPVNLIVWAVAVPALVSALVFALFRLAFRRFKVERADAAAGALAVGFGYLAGHGSLALPAFPPIDVTDRIPWILALAISLEFAEALSPAPLWARLENRLLLMAVALGAILGPILASTTETKAGVVWLGALAIVALLSQINIDAQAERTSPAATSLSRLAILIAAGITLLASGSVILGELGLALAAAYGSVAVLSLRAGRAVGGPILGAAVGALLIDGYIYASLPASAATALIAAPFAAWLGSVPALRRGAGWKSSAVVLVPTLAILGAAVALALAASPSYGE